MIPLPIDQQIEALVEAHDREMARLHLGCSPYDEDPDESSLPDTWRFRFDDQANAPA